MATINGRPGRTASRWDAQAEYVGRECTINGHRAKIVRMGPDGAGGTYAGVARLDGKGETVPYSWTTIYNVMDNHAGRFAD